jgi:NADH-quinone oxidoreductase subunit C
MMEDHGSPALRRLFVRFPDAVHGTHAHRGDVTAIVDAQRVDQVLGCLRDDPELAFEMLTDLTCVDHFGEEPRFEVVYHLYSVAKNHRVRIKARVPESAPELPSVIALYASADWMEREVWDLYGVRFRGHPDLRRILLYDGFEGHPLRKDYPKERRQPLVGPRN